MGQLFAAFGVNWKLLIIQAVNFGLLLTVLSYFLYKPLMNIIDKRRNMIVESMEKAEAADRTLAEAKVEGEGIVGAAAREAEQLVASARSRADEKGTEIVRLAEAKARAAMKDAEERAEEAKRMALRESSQEIARAAMLAAEKILREKTA